MKSLALPFLALALLAGCDGGTQSAGLDTEDAEAQGNVVDGAVAPSPTPIATEIPAAFRGRWGLTAEDCEQSATGAQGLLTIDGDTLDFYESTGSLGTIEEAGDNRLRATFDFTGEGESWQRDVALDLENGGNTLVRREFGADAAAGPFRYSRCEEE